VADGQKQSRARNTYLVGLVGLVILVVVEVPQKVVVKVVLSVVVVESDL
jgi:hypothetical protein